jgi:hypothetical protein
MKLVLLFLFQLIQIGNAALGFSTLGYVTTAQFQQLLKANYTYYITMVASNANIVEMQGIMNIKRARDGKFFSILPSVIVTT